MARSGVCGAAALLFAVAFAWPVSACEGTDIVFEDKFADDAGGWAINKDVEVKDGSFTFNPNPGFEGTTSFTYTISDGTLTDTGTVTITVAVS